MSENWKHEKSIFDRFWTLFWLFFGGISWWYGQKRLGVKNTFFSNPWRPKFRVLPETPVWKFRIVKNRIRKSWKKSLFFYKSLKFHIFWHFLDRPCFFRPTLSPVEYFPKLHFWCTRYSLLVYVGVFSDHFWTLFTTFCILLYRTPWWHPLCQNAPKVHVCALFLYGDL